MVTVSGLGPGVGDQLHAERRLVEVRRLGGVADHEHHRIHAGHRERIMALVVLDQPDELLELLEVEIGLALLGCQRRIDGHGGLRLGGQAWALCPPERLLSKSGRSA